MNTNILKYITRNALPRASQFLKPATHLSAKKLCSSRLSRVSLNVNQSYSNAHTISKFKTSELTAERYYKVSEQSLSNLLDQLEELIQEEGDDTFDLEYSSGVLTLKLGNLGTYVINKQPPNKQIWLSSPISGPKRYDFDTKSNLWFYSRDGESLDSILSKELSQLLGVKVELEL